VSQDTLIRILGLAAAVFAIYAVVLGIATVLAGGLGPQSAGPPERSVPQIQAEAPLAAEEAETPGRSVAQAKHTTGREERRARRSDRERRDGKLLQATEQPATDASLPMVDSVPQVAAPGSSASPSPTASVGEVTGVLRTTRQTADRTVQETVPEVELDVELEVDLR
jgi:hypothetical protein